MWIPNKPILKCNGEIRKRPWHPAVTLLHACIIFLLIRVLNDLPSGSDYFSHPPGFLILEMLCTILASFLCVNLTARWVSVVSVRKIPLLVEYTVPIVGVICIVGLIMLVSHSYDGSILSFDVMLPPMFVAVAMEVLILLWIKSSETERQLHESRLNNERIINKQLQTEMKLLQLQFHPHFLFNMLNTIYFTIDDDNVEAKSAVEHLSNLLRGQLYTTEGKVPLTKEISYLNSYIYLASKRLEMPQNIDIRFPDIETNSERYSDLLIYPHLLLPLVENVFKHTGTDGKIVISLRVEDGWIKLSTTNPLPETAPYADESGHGIGLSNLTQRLALIYSPDEYLFETQTDDGTYRSKLYLKI